MIPFLTDELDLNKITPLVMLHGVVISVRTILLWVFVSRTTKKRHVADDQIAPISEQNVLQYCIEHDVSSVANQIFRSKKNFCFLGRTSPVKGSTQHST